MKTLTRTEIQEILPTIDLIPTIETGFVRYSQGAAVVPPVGELIMDDPPGDVHIKYGYLRQADYYVIKIASGFYQNPQLGLPSSNGLMLLFSQKTGELLCSLLDEGYLTDIRTAVAGAIAAKYLAPKQVERIGIVGTGIQARLQLEHLQSVTSCRDVLVWGRGESQLTSYQAAMEKHGFSVVTTQDVNDIAGTCNLIVTTTPSSEPLLLDGSLSASGVHITAVGSDTTHKQEVDSAILGRADLVVADSIPQCLSRGEIYKAIEAGVLEESALVELGKVVSGEVYGRTSEQQVTVADLTGVAVQDIQIATAVYEAGL